MPDDREIRYRHSFRLREYDYSQPGAYFITICTYNRQCLFGDVVVGEMVLNEFGKIVEQCWLETERIRRGVIVDAFVVMPNHLHGIIFITDEYVGAYCNTPLRVFRSPSKTIGAIVRGFKSASTKRINQIRQTPGFPVWQRNYYMSM